MDGISAVTAARRWRNRVGCSGRDTAADEIDGDHVERIARAVGEPHHDDRAALSASNYLAVCIDHLISDDRTSAIIRRRCEADGRLAALWTASTGQPISSPMSHSV